MDRINQLLKDISRFGRLYRDERLAPLGLSSRHGMYLRQISAEPGISQEQLAGRIGINKSNVARQAASLEEEGYIERRPCGKDKRVLRLYLTQKAQDLLPSIEQVMADWEQKMVGDLSVSQQQTLYSLLQQVRENALPGSGEVDE